jgi:hypothetical protein
MKKTLTTILLFASATLAFGQSIHIKNHDTNADVTGQTITIKVDKGTKSALELALTNTTSNKLEYVVARTILNPPLPDTCGGLYFCTGVKCYGPVFDTQWESPDTSVLKPNETLPNSDTTYGIAAHYDVCDNVCNNLTVLYTVYLANKKTDYATVTIKYTCSTGIREEQALGSLSNAYPNPATSSFSVDYSMPVFTKSQIELYDLFGKKLIELPLQKNEGTAIINTSSLAPGVYFYTLMVGTQRAETKRLIISE